MATACAMVLNEKVDCSVTIWGRKTEQIERIRQNRQNQTYLPGVAIPDEIELTADIAQAVEDADYYVVAVPTKFLRGALGALRSHLAADVPVVSVVKGIENQTFLRPSQIIADVIGSTRIVSLSGPSHAEEVATRLPASVVVAGDDETLVSQVQEMFSTDRLRVYSNSDLLGVELAGALKNVVAIAAGISDGCGYGDNAKAALLTRGLVEITRFGVQHGAQAETFGGLAGLGDLVTTCCSRHSRNRAVGERLGRGETPDQIFGSMQAVAEGVNTAKSVHDIAAQDKIDMPIVREVYRVLFEGESPHASTDRLMMRPLRDE